MEVVTGATSSVLSKLGTLLQEEYYLQKGVKDDVESLQNELIFMRAALRKVAEVPPEKLDTQVKAWAGNIKELSYDMKDAVDTYEVRVAGNGIDGEHYCGWIVKMVDTVNKVKARHLLAEVIAEMKGLSMQVAELRDRYKLDIIAASTSDNTSAGAAQDVKVSINYQLLPWWRPRPPDVGVISLAVTGLIKARLASSFFPGRGSNQEGEDDTAPAIPPLMGMKDPVGVVKDMEKLRKWMTNSSYDGDRVRCIQGVGGVGKTTVATALYRKYGHLFDHRAKVTVSSSSGSGSGAAVLKRILEQVMPHVPRSQGGNGAEIKKTRRFSTAAVGRMLPSSAACCGWLKPKGDGAQAGSSSGARDALSFALRKKSCLLLIDGVRSEKSWREISVLLPQELSAQSRILITTRYRAVAAACDKKGSATYKMAETLDKECSREVFMEALSESRNGRKEKGNANGAAPPPARLWEMCVNSPLALTVMAGHVACNPNKSAEEWRQVCSDLLPDSVEAITRAGVPRLLRHCYHDMPAEIKTCFLYLSMYAKGRKISRKHLTRRWMAEGFVGPKPGQSVEQVADGYFDQLITRKFVQAVEQSSSGKVKSCRVYAVVHDFIVSMASEENLVTVFGGGDSYLLPQPSGGKVRRLSLYLPAAQSWNMSHVRTLAVFEGLNGEEDNVAKDSTQQPLPPDSPILQVLDLQGCTQKVDMSLLCRMLLLKYLSLRGTDIKSLPREIGKLTKLETLDVRQTKIRKLPNTVWHLEGLLCILGGDKTTRKSLKLPACNNTGTKKKAMMRSLRVLSGIKITEDSLVHLKELTKLRKLAIYKYRLCKKSIESLETWITGLGDHYLHTLLISSSPDAESISIKNSSFKQLTALDVSARNILAELPEWIEQHGALTKLTLPMALLLSSTLDKLKSMSSLFYLAFSLTEAADTPSVELEDKVVAILERNTAESDGEIVVPAGEFKRLQILRFSAPSMPPLSFMDNAMPYLERLELRSRSMQGLFGIENLKKLKEVHLSLHVGADNFTKSLVENIAAAASEYYKDTRIIRDEYQD